MFVSSGHEIENICNSDPYFSDTRMNTANLMARNASCASGYLAEYISCIQPFTALEQRNLTELVRKASGFINCFPKRRLFSIRWKFAKLSCALENGYPHTLGDTIILNQAHTQPSIDVLIHEKIHVFQRMYPQVTESLISGVWGYTSIGTKVPSDARNNPDLDGHMYRDRSSVTYMALRPNARSIDESFLKSFSSTDGRVLPRNTDNYEHPYERMAYQLTDIILQQKCYTTPEYDWMLKNL